MCKIIEIAISKKFKAKMESVDYIEAVEGKGIINDRYFKENNHKKSQITLIEIENIDYYNTKYDLKIDEDLSDSEEDDLQIGMDEIGDLVDEI